MKLLAKNVNNGEKYEGKHFQLTADIDLNNEPNWTPIGTEDTLFQGTFDGGRHQIANLKISNGGEYAGLFGNVWGATIQNCNVTGEVNGYNYSGGIVGYANNNTHILNCSFQGNVEGDGEERGGIVGHTSIGCDVSGCFVTGTVTGEKFVGRHCRMGRWHNQKLLRLGKCNSSRRQCRIQCRAALPDIIVVILP